MAGQGGRLGNQKKIASARIMYYIDTYQNGHLSEERNEFE